MRRLKECKAQLEAEARKAAREQRAKIEERKREERRRGKKLRGRKPKAPNPAPADEAKANVTDPESRIMKTRSGYVQGYNAQAAVTENQIVIAAELTIDANDVRQLHPMLAASRESLKSIGERERIGSLPSFSSRRTRTGSSERRCEISRRRAGGFPLISRRKTGWRESC